MAEFSFNCPFCNLELSIDESGIGQEIECPGCKEVLIIPAPGGGGDVAAEEEARGPAIPQGSFPEAKIIKNASQSLNVAAKTVKKLRVKSFRHHEHMKDGKDTFDDAVSAFLALHPEDDIISITGIQYTHHLKQKDAEGKETATPITEYGVLVEYKA
jgi:hypothetical protein